VLRTTKNCEGRVFDITPELQRLLKQQRHRADREQRERSMIEQHVFFRFPLKKNGGVASSVVPASARAGSIMPVPGPEADRMPREHLHDFRRHPPHDPAGIPERVAAKLSGQKTRRVFDRYNVVRSGDLREASRRVGPTFGYSTSGCGSQDPQNSSQFLTR
jgi:hypothetical protein